MPERWLTEAETSRFIDYPAEISEMDLIPFFTLTDDDRKLITRLHHNPNRLGFALQLCTLRYLGFVPNNLQGVPAPVIKFLARQLDVSPEAIDSYGERAQTRTNHLTEIEEHLGFHKTSAAEKKEIGHWLRERALEHDRPLLLLQLLCERLHERKITRPGLTLLERSVTTARQQAHAVTWEMIAPLLSKEDRNRLDQLLAVNQELGLTPLTWYRTAATAHSAGAILKTLKKIAQLRTTKLNERDLSLLNPNRLKLLARIGRRATNQSLQRMPEERCYPVLLAFLHQSLIDLIDEAVDLFDRNLAEAYSRAGRELDEFRISVAKATNEKVNLFQTIGAIILDPTVEDARLRSSIYQKIAPEKLRVAVDECEQITRPLDDSYFDLLGTRYSNIRQFAPQFLETFEWRARDEDEPLLEAIAILQELNAAGLRKVPDDAPCEFIPKKWLQYALQEDGQYSRRYYELCLLWEMRAALRNGNLWIEGSRRYTDPETYLIPPTRWPDLKTEACRLMKVQAEGEERLEQKTAEFKAAAQALAEHLAGQERVRIEEGELIVGPLPAEERPASAVELETLVAERLP